MKSIGDLRRRRIFDKYADNLLFLNKSGIINTDLKYDRTYICPVCKGQFSETDLDQSSANPLTLEDVPPKSLGGKAELLTCRTCNNTCGHQIDFHLTERMVEIDIHNFKPGVVFAAQVEHKGKKVQAYIKVSESREITVKHHNKRNNPDTLKEYIGAIGKDAVINLSFKASKVDPRKLQIALLKTGFLLTFAKYGYAFILDPVYDQVRAQLKYPDENIYPLNFWFKEDALKQFIGVPFMMEPGMEAVFPIFSLKTDFTEHVFATVIPVSSKPVADVIASIEARFAAHHGFDARMDPMDESDFLTDAGAVENMLGWIRKIGDKA
jgi:hypothetical protein